MQITLRWDVQSIGKYIKYVNTKCHEEYETRKTYYALKELYQISWILKYHLRYSIILNTAPKIIVITANTIILSLVMLVIHIERSFLDLLEKERRVFSIYHSFVHKKIIIRENKLTHISKNFYNSSLGFWITFDSELLCPCFSIE